MVKTNNLKVYEDTKYKNNRMFCVKDIKMYSNL